MAQEMTAASKQELERRSDSEATRAAIVYRPDTDIYETNDHVVLVADLPGVAPDDVAITLERRVLSIRGRVGQQPHEGYRRVYAEYGEGDFERVFTLSEDIDRDHIEASHKDGVLTLQLPKAATVKTRKIDVKAT